MGVWLVSLAASFCVNFANFCQIFQENSRKLREFSREFSNLRAKNNEKTTRIFGAFARFNGCCG